MNEPTQTPQANQTTNWDADWKECTICGSDVRIERWNLGYHYCKSCGDVLAREERESWCIAQEYSKGNYQLITNAYARQTLRNTNQKNTRAEL